jgi:hypothetical protein
MRAAGPTWPLSSDEVEDPGLPGGILVGIGSLAIIVAGFIASAIPQSDAVVRYGVLVVTILGFAAACRRWGLTLIVAGIGFLIFDGFLVNQLGELSWHGWADAVRVGALGAAAIFGRLLGDIHQSTSRAPRPSGSLSLLDSPGSNSNSMAFSKFVKEETHDA